MGVMNSVIFAAHDGIHVPIHCIVDIGRPYGGEEDHAEMGQVMARDEWQEINIRTCLQHAIKWMKGNRSPGRKRFGFVVIVVLQMDVFVEEFVCVKSSVHPVDSNFDAEEIEAHRGNVILPSTNFLNGVVHLRVTAFDQEFIQHGQHSVNGQGRLRQFYLTLDGFPGGSCSPLGLEDLFGLGVDVAKVMKCTRGPIVNKHCGDKVSHVTKDVVCPLYIVIAFMYDPSCKTRGKEYRIDPGIEITAGISQWVVLKNSGICIGK